MNGEAPGAGWYQDPHDSTPGNRRYWDGAAWTEHVHRASAPPPATSLPPNATAQGAPVSAAPSWGAPSATGWPSSGGAQRFQAQVAVADVTKSNGLSVASLVLGIGAVFFALIPIIGLFSVPFALVGLVLGFAGRSRAKRGYEGGGMAIAGVVTSVLALAISVLYVAVLSGSGDDNGPSSGGDQVERLGSREQPLAFGQNHDIGDGWTVRVAEFVPDANAMVAEANMFNSPPNEGNQHVLVKPAATYTGDAETATTFDLTFRLVGASGVTIESYNANCVAPEPSWNSLGQAFAGGTLEGYVCFEVPVIDLDSIVLIAEPTLAFSGNRAYLALK